MGVVVATWFDGRVRHQVKRFVAPLQGGWSAPVTVCGQYGRQGDDTDRGTIYTVSCEACQQRR